jgi:hypothetical protein
MGGRAPTFANPGTAPGGPATMPGGAVPGGVPGGLLDASIPDEQLVAMLSENASDFTWVAAAVGSQSASGYQLATGHSVMPIGGFNGSDPSPTLERFQQYVAEGRIHYFVAGGGSGGRGGGPGGAAGSGTSHEIARWVEENFAARSVAGVTVYDLTA